MNSLGNQLLLQENVPGTPTTVPILIGQLCMTLGGLYRWDGAEWNLVGDSSGTVSSFNGLTGSIIGITIGNGAPPSVPVPPDVALYIDNNGGEIWEASGGVYQDTGAQLVAYAGGAAGLLAAVPPCVSSLNGATGNIGFLAGDSPIGNIDGSNLVFTLTNTPIQGGVVSVLYSAPTSASSVVVNPNTYSVDTNIITFYDPDDAPAVGGALFVSYFYQETS